MIYKAISNRILTNLSSHTKINMDHRDIYAYALEKYLSGIFNSIIFIITAIVLQIPLETIAFSLFYIPIRKYAGGIHAKTRTGCLILSLVIMVSIIKAATLIAMTDYWVGLSLLGLVVAAILIFYFAPTDCENKRLSLEVKRHNKVRARIILVIELLIILAGILFFPKLDRYIVIAVMGLLLEGIFLLPNKLMEDKNYEEVKGKKQPVN